MEPPEPRRVYLDENKQGPQRQWLFKIGKAEIGECSCGAPAQSGQHVVWECRLHEAERRRCRITGSSWEDLDRHAWIKETTSLGTRVDGTEVSFGYLPINFKRDGRLSGGHDYLSAIFAGPCLCCRWFRPQMAIR